MPLIKAQEAVPLFKNAVVLDLSDIAQQARQIKEAAKQRADDMIEQARVQAKKVTETHASQGYDEGYAKGQADGHAQGFEEGSQRGHELGRNEQMQQIQEQFGPLVTAWTEAAKAWDQYHASLEQDTRDSVIELALRLAEKIVYRQVAVDPTVAVDQVSAALKAINGATRLTIHINAKDRVLIDEMVPHWLEQFLQFKQMTVQEDSSIERGGCILVHEHGKLDATLQTQLRRAVELLLPTPPEPPEASEVLPQPPAPPETPEVSDVVSSESSSVSEVEALSESLEVSPEAGVDTLSDTKIDVSVDVTQDVPTGPDAHAGLRAAIDASEQVEAVEGNDSLQSRMLKSSEASDSSPKATSPIPPVKPSSSTPPSSEEFPQA